MTYLNRYYASKSVAYVSAKLVASRRFGELHWLKFSCEKGCLGAKPAQFLLVNVYGFEAVPMSVAWCDETGFELIVRPVGETTRALVSLPLGSVVGVIGPLGKPLSSSIPGDSVRLVFVGGGSGVAPVLYACGYYASRGYDVKCFLGFRDENEAGLRSIFEDHGLPVVVSCEKGRGGVCDHTGVVLDNPVLMDAIDEADVVIASGPLPMLCRLYRMCAEKLVVILESYVKCGLGFCGSCRLWRGGPLLCRDGPAFRAVDVRRVLEACVIESLKESL